MGNPRVNSPLRYPGGKSCLTNFLTELASLNGVAGGTYIELYAGGAGAAISLLFNGTFEYVHINDYDYSIYSFWHSILNRTEEFISLIENTSIDINEWHRQRDIYALGKEADQLSLGFATFFLNRTNRSGILYKAGPIGGFNQKGNYRIDVRFNKNDLIKRIEKIALFKDKIYLTNLDAVFFLENIDLYYPDKANTFLYLDPPYYNKGKQLYLNNYNHDGHLRLSQMISNLGDDLKWLISYDNVEEIRKLYSDYRKSSFDLNYTLQSKKFGSELLVFGRNVEIGNSIIVNNRRSELVLINEDYE